MKRGAFSLLLPIAAVAVCTTALQAAPVNATGRWQVHVSSGAEFYSGVVTFSQVGQTVIGRAGSNAINGTMRSDTQMDAQWNGPKGAGWMTFNFGPGGNSFQGEWGYNGRKADGKFVGKRMTASAD